MNKSIENSVEIGVNLVFAVAVIYIIIVMLQMGRDSAVKIEQEDRARRQTNEVVEFNDLGGTTISYARAVELVTYYAGRLDIYVDNTSDGGAILLSARAHLGGETMSTVIPNTSFTRNAANDIIYSASPNMTTDQYMLNSAHYLLQFDLTAKFMVGKWKVYLALGNESVGNTTHTNVGVNDVVTGIRLQRVN